MIQVGSLQSLPLAMETVTSQLSSLQQNAQSMLQQLNTLALAVHSLSQFYRQVREKKREGEREERRERGWGREREKEREGMCVATMDTYMYMHVLFRVKEVKVQLHHQST